MSTACNSNRAIDWISLTTIGLTLLLFHAGWYLSVWPGPMGPDGYSLIANINEGAPRYTGKDPAWLLYALGTYGISGRIEWMMIPLVILHVAIFTRIIYWIYTQGHKKTSYTLFFFIACAPHILNFETSLYPDSIFNLAFIAILFEIWLCLKKGKVTPINLLIIITLFPIAGFFRGNGIIILIPILYLATQIKGSTRWIIVASTIIWIGLIHIGEEKNDLGSGHGVLKPLILFETLNFMQSKPMNLWENQHMVTDKTKKIVYQYVSQENIDSLFDRDYWDTFWHQNAERSKLRHMSKQDSKDLFKEFFKYNLWRNIPAFVSSRVNIFLAAAFAQGGFSTPDNAKHTINNVVTKSNYNPFNLTTLPKASKSLFDFSYENRFILWTPFIGIFLAVLCFKKSIQQRKTDDLIITSMLIIQLCAIFTFSIAAEYRYLLVFFYAPLLLIPIFYHQKHKEALVS